MFCTPTSANCFYMRHILSVNSLQLNMTLLQCVEIFINASTTKIRL